MIEVVIEREARAIMGEHIENLLIGFKAGFPRALARTISLIEDRSEGYEKMMSEL